MTTEDLTTIYRGIRGRVSDLVRDLDEATLERIAPATPLWTVHDVLAHLVGDVTDIVDGNLDGVATDADRKSTRLNSSHVSESRMPSSA